MYGDRMARYVSGGQSLAEVQDRARLTRWTAKGVARVTHPAHGSVIVPHSSNFTAILNAAEVWGCDWTAILRAEVWAAKSGERPVPMPHIYK